MPKRAPTSPKHPTQCQACDAPIWFKLVAGPGPKPLLLPLRARPDPAGTVAAASRRDWQHGRFLARDEQPDPAMGEERWMSHFDDCPDADAFRKDRRKVLADLAASNRQHGRRDARPAPDPAEQPALFGP